QHAHCALDRARPGRCARRRQLDCAEASQATELALVPDRAPAASRDQSGGDARHFRGGVRAGRADHAPPARPLEVAARRRASLHLLDRPHGERAERHDEPVLTFARRSSHQRQAPTWIRKWRDATMLTLTRELFAYVGARKKWWLLPVLL